VPCQFSGSPFWPRGDAAGGYRDYFRINLQTNALAAYKIRYHYLDKGARVPCRLGPYPGLRHHNSVLNVMSPDQEKIGKWLAAQSPTLGEAYTVALRLLADVTFPGRAQMICHAGRDLCTGLQDLRGVAKRERADTTRILREIEPVWEKEGLDARGIVEAAESAPSVEQTTSPEVTMSQHLMTLLQRLIQEHRRGSTNQEDQAAELFREKDPATVERPEALRPLLKEWVRLRQWFHHYAHFAVQQRTPDERELQEQFASLENFILGFIRTFYEGMEGLDEILEEANS